MIPLSINQLPLPLPGDDEAVFEQLLGRANQGAVATLRSIARAELADWGYLSAPPGAGKSHALMAACRVADAAGRRAGYLTATLLIEHGAEALEALGGFEFLALDDLDRLLVGADWEEGLFHCLNRWRAAGCQVLVAGATPARGLKLALPDLGSRLAALTEIRLKPLEDDAERAELLRRRARARGIVLSDEVIGFLLRRHERGAAALVGLLDALSGASLAEQRRITVPFVKALLERGSG